MRGEDGFMSNLSHHVMGSPPHARGRLYDLVSETMTSRITPACAGKTRNLSACRQATGDHPRMRGEDFDGHCPYPRFPWITPACAGKTLWRACLDFRVKDHPRMRGEDS